MENASKALLIAGGVLLMILVLTFAVFLFGRMANSTSDIYRDIQESHIQEFNQKFFNYERNNLNIQDVVSIINLAKDNNENGKFPVEITVTFKGTPVQDKDSAYIQEILKEYIDKKDFKCKVEYANNSDLVGKVTISE